MLSIDVLNHDCLIHVFMFLDIENLTSMVAVNKDQYLAAGKIVFKRKFLEEFTILDSSCAVMTNYVNRLNYFGDLITKLRISLPLPRVQQIFNAINDNCKQSLTEIGFHCADDDDFSNDAFNAIGLFFRHLDSFTQLRVLQCKYGDLHTNSGKFESLNICIPKIPTLNEMTIDGFGGILDKNTKTSIASNPQLEKLNLWTGYENLHSSYLTYIASQLKHLKSLDLRFAVFFPLDGSTTPLNFECLETLKVVCFFNLSGNTLPFSGDLMNKLENLDYICATTNDQLINIVSQFKQLKKLKIGAYGLIDEHLTLLAQNLEKIEFLDIVDLPSNQETKFSFTSEGIRQFLDKRNELEYLFISMKQENVDVNKELIVNIKQVLANTEWTVLEQNLTETRYIVIFK